MTQAYWCLDYNNDTDFRSTVCKLRRLFLATKLTNEKKFSAAGFFVLLSLLSPRATHLAECQMMTASSSGIKKQIKKCMQVKSTNNNKKNNNIWKPRRCLSPASYKELFCSPFETYGKIKTILDSWPARCCNKGKKTKRPRQYHVSLLSVY